MDPEKKTYGEMCQWMPAGANEQEVLFAALMRQSSPRTPIAADGPRVTLVEDSPRKTGDPEPCDNPWPFLEILLKYSFIRGERIHGTNL